MRRSSAELERATADLFYWRARHHPQASKSIPARNRSPVLPGEHAHRRAPDGLRGCSEAGTGDGRALRQVGAGCDRSQRQEGAERGLLLRRNAHALARYAAICQGAGHRPHRPAQVLMDGAHVIERCEEVTGAGHAVSMHLPSATSTLRNAAQAKHGGASAGGARCRRPVNEVAPAMGSSSPARPWPPSLHRVPVGGQESRRGDVAPERDQSSGGTEAVESQLFLRARPAGPSAQGLARREGDVFMPPSRRFRHRAKCDSAAVLGRYTTSMDTESAGA